MKSPVICTVGIDLSMAATGLTVYRNDGGEPSSCAELQTVKTKPKDYDTDIERRESIVDYIMGKIPEGVSMVMVEDYYIPRNPKRIGSAIALIELGSLMRSAMWRRKVPFAVPVASQIKKFATGKGNAGKEVVFRDVWRRWKIDAKDDNQADSCALAFMAEAAFRVVNNLPVDHLPKFQVEMAAKVMRERPRYDARG